jgi:hypothetical protein
MGIQKWNALLLPLYYYRKERSGEHVCSVYVGRGEMAEMAHDGMQQEDQRTRERRDLEAFEPLNADIDALARLTFTLTQAVLIAAGFHQHKREWRKLKA